jgi:hypothetical protein
MTMTSRITERDLQGVVDRINRVTNSPAAPYAKDETGRMRAQVGNYHISHAYGGVCLHRMFNEGGGVSTPLCSGHVPKRELYNLMHAYLRGMESGE